MASTVNGSGHCCGPQYYSPHTLTAKVSLIGIPKGSRLTYVSDANGYLTYLIERQQQSFKLDRGSKVAVLSLADATNSDYFEMHDGVASVASSQRLVSTGRVAGGLVAALGVFIWAFSAFPFFNIFSARVLSTIDRIRPPSLSTDFGGAEQITASIGCLPSRRICRVVFLEFSPKSRFEGSASVLSG